MCSQFHLPLFSLSHCCFWSLASGWGWSEEHSTQGWWRWWPQPQSCVRTASDCRLPNPGLLHGALGNRSLFFLSLCVIFFEWLIEASSHLLAHVQNFDSCNLLTYEKFIHRSSHESLPTCGPLSFPAISGQSVSLPSSRENILKER